MGAPSRSHGRGAAATVVDPPAAFEGIETSREWAAEVLPPTATLLTATSNRATG